MKQFIATKALIEFEGRVLVIRESSEYEDGTNANKFDVVGGRLEVGEKFYEALVREAKEEAGLDIEVGDPFFVSEWRPNVKGEDWQIVGIFFKCQTLSNQVSLSKDHDKYLWIDPKEYKEVGVIENLFPVFDKYIQNK